MPHTSAHPVRNDRLPVNFEDAALLLRVCNFYISSKGADQSWDLFRLQSRLQHFVFSANCQACDRSDSSCRLRVDSEAWLCDHCAKRSALKVSGRGTSIKATSATSQPSSPVKLWAKLLFCEVHSDSAGLEYPVDEPLEEDDTGCCSVESCDASAEYKFNCWMLPAATIED
jgi:hypothetical protein